MGKIFVNDEEYVGNYAVRSEIEHRLRMIENDFKGVSFKRLGIINKTGEYILPACELYTKIEIIDEGFAIVNFSDENNMLIKLGEVSYEIIRQLNSYRVVNNDLMIITTDNEVLYDYKNNKELSHWYTKIGDYKPYIDGCDELFAKAYISIATGCDIYGYIDLKGDIRSKICSTTIGGIVDPSEKDFDFDEFISKSQFQAEEMKKYRKMDDWIIVKSIKR